MAARAAADAAAGGGSGGGSPSEAQKRPSGDGASPRSTSDLHIMNRSNSLQQGRAAAGAAARVGDGGSGGRVVGPPLLPAGSAAELRETRGADRADVGLQAGTSAALGGWAASLGRGNQQAYSAIVAAGSGGGGGASPHAAGPAGGGVSPQIDRAARGDASHGSLPAPAQRASQQQGQEIAAAPVAPRQQAAPAADAAAAAPLEASLRAMLLLCGCAAGGGPRQAADCLSSIKLLSDAALQGTETRCLSI